MRRRHAGMSTKVYRFGAFEFDADTPELRRSGMRLHLAPQALALLKLLIEGRDDRVGREEIRRALWPDGYCIASDDAINTLVRQLRRALADHATAPHVIETIPRRGYRFIAPVTVAQNARPAAGAPARASLIVLALLLLSRSHPSPARPPAAATTREANAIQSVSLAKFDVDGRPGTAALATAIATNLLSDLSALQATHPTAASRRDDLVVAGTISNDTGTLHVEIRCVNAKSRQTRWTGTFDSTVRGAAALAENVARTTARAIADTDEEIASDERLMTRALQRRPARSVYGLAGWRTNCLPP